MENYSYVKETYFPQPKQQFPIKLFSGVYDLRKTFSVHFENDDDKDDATAVILAAMMNEGREKIQEYGLRNKKMVEISDVVLEEYDKLKKTGDIFKAIDTFRFTPTTFQGRDSFLEDPRYELRLNKTAHRLIDLGYKSVVIYGAHYKYLVKWFTEHYPSILWQGESTTGKFDASLTMAYDKRVSMPRNTNVHHGYVLDTIKVLGGSKNNVMVQLWGQNWVVKYDERVDIPNDWNPVYGRDEDSYMPWFTYRIPQEKIPKRNTVVIEKEPKEVKLGEFYHSTQNRLTVPDDVRRTPVVPLDYVTLVTLNKDNSYLKEKIDGETSIWWVDSGSCYEYNKLKEGVIERRKTASFMSGKLQLEKVGEKYYFSNADMGVRGHTWRDLKEHFEKTTNWLTPVQLKTVYDSVEEGYVIIPNVEDHSWDIPHVYVKHKYTVDVSNKLYKELYGGNLDQFEGFAIGAIAEVDVHGKFVRWRRDKHKSNKIKEIFSTYASSIYPVERWKMAYDKKEDPEEQWMLMEGDGCYTFQQLFGKLVRK